MDFNDLSPRHQPFPWDNIDLHPKAQEIIAEQEWDEEIVGKLALRFVCDNQTWEFINFLKNAAQQENDGALRNQLADQFWSRLEDRDSDGGTFASAGKAILYLLEKIPVEVLEPLVEKYNPQWVITRVDTGEVAQAGFKSEKEAKEFLSNSESGWGTTDQYKISWQCD